jgi:hypothetical protein
MKKLSSSLKMAKKIVSLNKYTGEWVAFSNGKPIAHGENLRKLMNKVKKLKDKPKASVMLVPKKTEGNHIV